MGLWLLGLGLIAGAAAALDPAKRITQYSLSSWQVADGLPQDTVRCVAQTPDGYLWIGTEAGLTRFDGIGWEIYNRASHPEFFRNSHIYALAVTPDGVLWIGTYGTGLVSLRPDGEMRRFGTEHGLPAGRVTSLAPSADGSLWVGTYGGGVARLHEGAVQVLGVEEGLSHPVVFDLREDALGTLWVGTYGGGVNRWNGHRFEVLDTSDGLLDNNVWVVYPSSDGSVWIGTNGGLQRWSKDRMDSFTVAQGLSHNRVLSALEDRDGNLWVGTYGGGLNRLRGSEFQVLGTEDGLTSAHIWELFEDGEGSLWLGTLGGGLTQVKDGVFTTVSEPEGLSSALPSSFFEDTDGSLWVASRTGGLDVLQGGRVVSRLTAKDGLPSNSLWASMIDRQGHLWVATSGSGLARRRGADWDYWDTSNGLAGLTVFVMTEDADGAVWLGTNKGLNRFADGKMELFTVDDGLGSDQIRALHRGKDGRLWVGTVQGLSYFSGRTFHSFEAPNVAVQDIWQDRDEPRVLWLGTSGEGLIRFELDLESGATTQRTFNTENGFFEDQVRVVLEDDAGFLWVAGSRGVVRVAKADLESIDLETRAGAGERLPYLSFGERDGLKSASIYGGQPGGLKTQDGRIWLATLDGIVSVDPASLESPPAPEVRLQALWVDHENVGERRRFPSRSKAYRFDLSAQTLSVPEKIDLRYRLLGFGDEWRPVNQVRSVELGLLGPGSYVFETQAGDETGRWNGPVTRIPFVVEPAFHQTKVFFALCVAAAMLLGFALHLVRVARFHRRERDLSRRVEEALARVTRLQGMLPICASCKKIRSDEGYWEQIETYIDSHSDVTFSHGICPSCTGDLFPELKLSSEEGQREETGEAS